MPMVSLHDLTSHLIEMGVVPPLARNRIYLPNGRPNFKDLLAVLQEEGVLSPETDAAFLASPDLPKLIDLLQARGVL